MASIPLVLALVSFHLFSPTPWEVLVAHPSGKTLGTTFVGGLRSSQPASRPSPDELARALQARYDAIRDFTADFVHTYEGGVLRTQATERGTVLIKKPGKMRWNYTSPEEKLFVSDGVKIYSYIPADNQVYVFDMPLADEATTPVLFLTGKGNLTHDFTIAYADLADLGADMYALKLTPRQTGRDYEWLTLVIDANTLQIRRLLAHDLQGGTSAFFLTNLKENVSLADTEFTFRIPRGADVILSDSTFQ